MDNCVVNGWETFKGWTPYIMGIVVLAIWFFQKQREVLAVEAKEVVKDLLELSIINFDINFVGTHSKVEFESKLLKFKEVSEKAHRSMLFINNNKKIRNLKELLESYYQYKETVYHPINNTVRLADEIRIIEFMQLKGTKDNARRLDKCISEIIKILQPYSVYKKIL
ncbi:hypothetical protein [Acinetobacter guillouiae]|uniref:hypothetical protein n=1 Tax=Acinetobacter guillouiae TaxID=106649 RepID=UPI0032B3ED27